MCLPVHLCSSESLSTDAEVEIPMREATYHPAARGELRTDKDSLRQPHCTCSDHDLTTIISTIRVCPCYYQSSPV